VDSKGDESSVAEVRKMIRLFKEPKEHMQKQINAGDEVGGPNNVCTCN
jgi:hypothetical protein